MDYNEISVSYGESLRLQTPMTLDTEGLTSLTFNIGKGGDYQPELSIVATVTAATVPFTWAVNDRVMVHGSFAID